MRARARAPYRLRWWSSTAPTGMHHTAGTIKSAARVVARAAPNEGAVADSDELPDQDHAKSVEARASHPTTTAPLTIEAPRRRRPTPASTIPFNLRTCHTPCQLSLIHISEP